MDKKSTMAYLALAALALVLFSDFALSAPSQTGTSWEDNFTGMTGASAEDASLTGAMPDA